MIFACHVILEDHVIKGRILAFKILPTPPSPLSRPHKKYKNFLIFEFKKQRFKRT